MPADARGIAHLETHDAVAFLDTRPPPGVTVNWLHGTVPGAQPELLADAVQTGDWLPGRVGVFAHGERASMKAVRAALKLRLADNDELSLSGYWAYGRTEDVFQAEKREPIGKLD